MELAQKLKELRSKNNLTQKELADKLGILPEVYRKWENGRGNPKKKSLEKIANAYNMTYEQLTNTEILPIYKELSPKKQNKIIEFAKKLEDEDEDDRYPYDVINQGLSAGCGECYSDELDYTRVYWENNIAYDYAVWIKGDSMEPVFHNYEVALIKKQSVIDYQGQVCAVDDTENGDAYIKCVYVEDEGYRLVSINQSLDEKGKLKYPDFVLPYDESPRIIGKVVSHFTPLKN